MQLKRDSKRKKLPMKQLSYAQCSQIHTLQLLLFVLLLIGTRNERKKNMQ